MKTSPLKFTELSHLHDVKSYDLFQIKFDGWFVNLDFEKNKVKVSTKTNRRLHQFDLKASTRVPEKTRLYGELIYGTNWAEVHPNLKGKIVVYDMFSDPVVPYHVRYRQLSSFVKLYPEQLLLVQNFPKQDIEELWPQIVSHKHEGVVCRDLNSCNYNLGKFKREFVQTYTVVGFVEGKGKHEGRLGALQICTLDESAEGTVGGGFSDELREAIWNDRDSYVGKQVEVVGKALFPSGLLRHPNFKGWKS